MMTGYVRMYISVSFLSHLTKFPKKSDTVKSFQTPEILL